MAKKFHTLLRQWAMLQLLPLKFPKDAAQIREALEEEGFRVDLRTVQRDLRELSEVFPITSDASKPIGWRWDKNAPSFDVPGMDRTGALTTKMVGDFMARLLPKSCLDSLGPNLRRANAILEDLGDRRHGGWPDKVRVVPRTQPLLPPEIEGDILETVYESLFNDTRFRAAYRRKGNPAPVEYVVNPLGLVASDPVLYLVATLWNYDDIKLLAVHRFLKAEMLDEPVRKPDGFSLDRYLASGALGFPVEEEKTIALKALFARETAFHLHESPLNGSQKLTDQGDGDVLVEAEVLDTQQVRWWLLSFGDKVEVLAPSALRREFAETARVMAGYYEG